MTSQVNLEFSNEQQERVQDIINAHFGEDITLHLGDCDIQLGAVQAEPTKCPIIFWNGLGCNFALMRTALDQYRAQYFYVPDQQFSTQQIIFTDIEDAALMLLQEQSDVEIQKQNHEKEKSIDEKNTIEVTLNNKIID